MACHDDHDHATSKLIYDDTIVYLLFSYIPPMIWCSRLSGAARVNYHGMTSL